MSKGLMQFHFFMSVSALEEKIRLQGTAEA